MVPMPQDIVLVTSEAKHDSYAHTDFKINKKDEIAQ